MADEASPAPAPAPAPDARVTTTRVTGSRAVEVSNWYERPYTLYQLEASVDGPSAAPITSERRFNEVADFHATWVEPLMSPDRPVFLPPKEPVSFVMKNDTDIVSSRVVSIREARPPWPTSPPHNSLEYRNTRGWP